MCAARLSSIRHLADRYADVSGESEGRWTFGDEPERRSRAAKVFSAPRNTGAKLCLLHITGTSDL
jgi:hypothetical protein